MLVSLETSMLIFFSKLEFLVYCDGPLSLFLAIAKTRYTQYHKWRRYISTYPSHLNCPVRTVSPQKLVFHAPVSFELSSFAFTVKASYYCRKSAVWKTLSAAPVDTFYGALTISCLTISPMSFNVIVFWARQSAPWRVVQLLGLCEVCLLLHPSKRVG